MKNKLLLTLAIFILSNCEIKVREAQAQTGQYSYIYSDEKRVIDGMEYMVFYVRDRSPQTGYAVTVVNLTKDKLEIELLKKQLADTIPTTKRK